LKGADPGPDAPLAAAALASLRAAGVIIDATLPADARAVRCWAEAIALERVPVTQTPSIVLLTTPDRQGVIDLAAELLRLGCERQELLVTPNGGVLRAIDPPTYTIVRAIDREQGLRGFAPDPHGQETVWTEIGYRHPLAQRLKADKDHLLLVANDGWRNIKDDGWKNLEGALELTVAGRDPELASVPLGERRKVELRFAPGRRDAPSLWVIRRGGTAAIDRLLEYLPEEVVARLTFAAAGRNANTRAAGMRLGRLAEGAIIIRARTGRHGPPICRSMPRSTHRSSTCPTSTRPPVRSSSHRCAASGCDRSSPSSRARSRGSRRCSRASRGSRCAGRSASSASSTARSRRSRSGPIT
jgi:hypothetical protein